MKLPDVLLLDFSPFRPTDDDAHLLLPKPMFKEEVAKAEVRGVVFSSPSAQPWLYVPAVLVGNIRSRATSHHPISGMLVSLCIFASRLILDSSSSLSLC